MPLPKTCVTLFSGGGGSDLGLISAGYKPVLAVEYDPLIANVYADNFGDKHLICADVCKVDYKPFAGVDLLAASPVCTRASVANANRGETELDTQCAEAVARAIDEIRPNHFLMENVRQYRSFTAYKIITDALDRFGYWWDANVVNCADHGIPQSRIRLVVRAAKDGYLPPLPSPTRRIGWYEAIEDLLPSCPESKLADWQIKRLPADFLDSFVFDNLATIRTATTRDSTEPMFTLTDANSGRRPANVPCAVLVPGVTTNFSHEELDFVEPGRPSPVLTASQTRHPFRAILMGGANTSDVQAAPGVGVSETNDPTRCVTQGSAAWRAVLVEGTSAGERPPTTLFADDPMFTLCSGGGGRVHRCVFPDKISTLTGNLFAPDDHSVRVVALTGRCLARFQSFPDSYRLPTKRSIAARVIGNAVPPELFKRIAGGFR